MYFNRSSRFYIISKFPSSLQLKDTYLCTKLFLMRLIIFALVCFISTLSFSQPQGKGKAAQTLKGEIFGNIVDSTTNQPMAYVTVLAKKQPTDEMAGGVVSSENGNFSITDLPAGKYTLELSFVGYDKKHIKDILISAEQITHNFKDLTISSKLLDEVEVVGDKPLVTYEIDKKVINVEDQITNTSQTALEILENAPSVTVDADGNVSLRGSSSFTLLIDGIPTAMEANDALATIPASTIKDIEIITNPSAKFDAEGTSGVINIVTKKNKLEGVSLLANLSAGTFDNYNGDVAVNIKKNKFTFNVAANYRQSRRPNDRYSIRTTTYDTTTTDLISSGQSDWSNNSYGASGEVQWAPNNSHVLIAKTKFNNRLMIPYSNLDYESYDNDVLTTAFRTDQGNYIELYNNTSSFFYQYNIKRNKDHNITVKAILNLVDVVQNDTTLNYDENGKIQSGNLYTETGPSNFTRYNIDYKLPLKNKKKFEAGLQSQFGNSGDVGTNYVYNSLTETFEINELFSSSVTYTRDVYAGYSMFSGMHKTLGYQFGLRGEYTYRTITSTTLGNFQKVERMDWFPSAHFSYGLKNKDQVLLSYSRRITRPRSYYFEPFITWESPFNVRTGNPDLIPEYINAFELSYIKPIAKNKGFFSLETYFRYVNNIITRISTVYAPNVLISKPYNIGTSNSIGIEPSVNYSVTKWWKLNAGANIYLYTLGGTIEGVDYTTESFNWDSRISNTFTVKGFNLQLNSRYNSRTVTAQGESQGYFTQDVSIKKGFDNNKYTFTLQGRNILNTQKRISTTLTENVYIYSERIPLYPQMSLTFSLKLNNYQKVFDREDIDDF